MNPRIPTIVQCGKPNAVTLFLMESKLRKLLKNYAYQVDKAIQRLPFISEVTLKRLNKLYEKGEITTVICCLKRGR